jgi:hypothetical protein
MLFPSAEAAGDRAEERTTYEERGAEEPDAPDGDDDVQYAPSRNQEPVALLIAEVHAASKGISQEMGLVRDQLARFVRDEIARVTQEQEEFRLGLIAEQSQLVDKIVTPLLAERDATVARIRAENQQLRDQMMASVGEEIAKLTGEQYQGEMVDQDELVLQIVAPVLAEREATLARVHADNQNLRDQLAAFFLDEATKLYGAQEAANSRLGDHLTDVVRDEIAKAADGQPTWARSSASRSTICRNG